MATPKWFLILRDVTLLSLGVFGILHQELSGQASPMLLAVYTALLGIPGAANALAIIRSATSAGASAPPPPVVPEPSQESAQ